MDLLKKARFKSKKWIFTKLGLNHKKIYILKVRNTPLVFHIYFSVGKDPAAMCSNHSNYDPYEQVQRRIKDLESIGHRVDKIFERMKTFHQKTRIKNN